MRRTTAICALACLGLAAVALAQDDAKLEPRAPSSTWFNRDDLSLSVTTAVYGKYMWRGIDIINEPVHQPEVYLGYKGLTLGVWANQELTNTAKHCGDFTEFDYSIDYSWSWKKLSFIIGYVNYRYPNLSLPENSDVYAGVELDVLLRPAIKVYREVDEAWGTYVKFSVGHTFEEVWKPTKASSVSVDLSASVGYGSRNHNDANYGTNAHGWTDVLLSLAVPIKLGKRWTLRPAIWYSSLLDGRIRENMKHDGNVWGSLALTWSF